MEKRKKLWTSLFEKYTSPGKSSASLTDFSSMKNKYEKIEGSKGNLVTYIEIELNSNLKSLLISRITHKILETKKYGYWQNLAEEEMQRLNNSIASEDIKMYCSYVINQVTKLKRDDTYNKLLTRSKLHKLLWEREILRNNKNQMMLILICKRLKSEWLKCAKIIPEEYLIKYAIEVMKNF